MKARQFWLTNANNVRYELYNVNSNDTITFLNEPEGLGYGVDISTLRLGNTDLILNEQYNLGSVGGELLFMGKRNIVYQQYTEFIKFLSKRPITLHYLTPNTNESFRCLVRVISVEKTEVDYDDGMLHCPIQMYRQSMWYDDKEHIIDAYNRVTDGKEYPLERPYHYGMVDIQNIEIYNDGMVDAPMKVEIFGRCTDPIFNIFDSDGTRYGATKINGSYEYVMVDSDDLNEQIVLQRGGSSIPNAINYQDLTVGDPQEVYVTFLKLKPGNSTIVFSLDNAFNGFARITWRNAYVSI